MLSSGRAALYFIKNATEPCVNQHNVIRQDFFLGLYAIYFLYLDYQKVVAED